MTKVTLNKLKAGYSSSNALNHDFEMIEAGFERTLDRHGGPGNAMLAPLDMNSERILNLPEPVEPTDVVRLQDFQNNVDTRVIEALTKLKVVQADQNGADFTDKEQLRYNIQVPTHNRPGFFMEVRVPSQYPTLQAAYNACEKYFGPSSIFQIKLDEGVHTVANVGRLDVNKPVSVDLRLVGNAANPSAHKIVASGPAEVVLSATARGAGIYVNGITIEHTDVDNRENTMAVLADDGGFVHMGPAAHTKGFFWNLFARRGGVIRSDGGSHINGGDTNALAYIGGVISAVGCTLTGANDLLSTLGSGAVCEGGALDISFAKLNGNKRSGLHCIEGYVRGMGSEFNNNTHNGVTQDGGHVDLTTGCVANNNGAYGYKLNEGSSSDLSLLSGSGNPLGLFMPYTKTFFDVQPGTRVVSPNANEGRRYDTKGNSSHYFNTGGGRQLEVFDTPDAVSHLAVAGASSGQPVIALTRGSAANIDLRFQPKGTGSVGFRSGSGSTKLQVNDAGVGFNGSAAVGKQSLGAAATDLASAITLVNNIRAALITSGLAQT